MLWLLLMTVWPTLCGPGLQYLTSSGKKKPLIPDGAVDRIVSVCPQTLFSGRVLDLISLVMMLVTGYIGYEPQMLEEELIVSCF